MRLIRAELLKARRRQATWVLLVLAAVLTILIYILLGRAIGGIACTFDMGDFGFGDCIVQFPAAYALIDNFAFTTLGGLLAIIYSAAFVGADWTWGTLRTVVARGESRANYLLAKAGALAIVLAIGSGLIFLLAFAMTFVTAMLNGVPIASPLRGNGLLDLASNLGLGYLVVLERAALGVAVAVVLRSQLAGAVVGIVLYLGEQIVTTFLTLASVSRFMTGFDPQSGGFTTVGPEWFQYLPMSIGNQVMSAAPGVTGSTGTGGGFEGLFLRPVPLELALPVLLIYLAVAMGLGILAFNRQEIT